MRKYLTQTHRERQGAMDGLGLFFGALLGANLGTVERLPLKDYIYLIIILAGTVMTLRMVSTSERRVYALLTLALYVVVVSAFLFLPPLRVEGLSEAAATRLGATLAIWVLAVLLLEYWPARDPEPEPAEADAPPG